jgi:AraC family transcriptional regulator of arabinose operon
MAGTAIDLHDPAAPAWPSGTAATWSPPSDRWFAGHASERPGYRYARAQGAGSWLVIATTGGTGRVRVPNRELLVANGSVVILGPRCGHDYGVPVGASIWEFRWFHMPVGRRAMLSADLLPAADGHADYQIPPGPTWDRLLAAIERLRADLFDPAMAQAEALATTATTEILLRLQGWNASRRHLDPRIAAVMDRLSADPSRPWSMAHLALQAGLSPGRLTRLFTAQVGRPPIAYLIGLRLDLAAQALAATDRPIATIAADVGFPSPFYFSRQFRRNFSCTPQAYRKRHMDSNATRSPEACVGGPKVVQTRDLKRRNGAVS